MSSASLQLSGVFNLTGNELAEMNNELGAFTNTIVELYATLDDDRLDSKTKIAKFMNLKELTLHFGAMYRLCLSSYQKLLDGEAKKEAKRLLDKLSILSQETAKHLCNLSFTSSISNFENAITQCVQFVEAIISFMKEVDNSIFETISHSGESLKKIARAFYEGFVIETTPKDELCELSKMEAKFKNFLGYFSKNVINRKKVILPSAIEALVEGCYTLNENVQILLSQARKETPASPDAILSIESSVDAVLAACRIIPPFVCQVMMKYDLNPLTAYFGEIRKAIVAGDRATLGRISQEMIEMCKAVSGQLHPEQSATIVREAAAVLKEAKVCIDSVVTGAPLTLYQLEHAMDVLNTSVRGCNATLETPVLPEEVESEPQQFDLLFAAKKLVEDGISKLIEEMNE